MKLKVRTVFISDAHLGSRGCRARDLSRFLKRVRCQRLYLVGDIIDMWLLKHRWYWPDSHNDVIRRILKIAKRGTEVYFLPGNHDDAARQYLDTEFGGVRCLPYAVHVTADGKRLLVVHGDEYDLVVTHSRLLSVLGGLAYEWLLVANRWYNALRRMFGMSYLSLSQAIKLKVKSACTFISKFEETLINEAKRRGVDGVVCGHIHKAETRTDEATGIAYYNCGDWIENCTALVEHYDGRLELLTGLAAPDSLRRRKRSAEDVAAAAALEHDEEEHLDAEPALSWQDRSEEALARLTIGHPANRNGNGRMTDAAQTDEAVPDPVHAADEPMSAAPDDDDVPAHADNADAERTQPHGRPSPAAESVGSASSTTSPASRT